MIVLIVGVLMGGVTTAAQADDMLVTARLLGPAPTTAATIESPSEGTTFTSKPITVNGTCPDDTYVKLLRNGVESGVAICDAEGRYSLQSDLFEGANQLEAQVYNSTDVPGPISAKTTVYYQAPVAAPPQPADPTPAPTAAPSQQTTTAPGPADGPAVPLLLGTVFRFGGSYVGQPASFDFTLSGGTGPYVVTVDWGDGTQSTMTVAASGSFTLEHIYQRAGTNEGTYAVKVTATDSKGATSFLQVIALVKEKPPAVAGPTDIGTTTPEAGGGILKYLWSVYGVIFLMVSCFWLGELREAQHLKPKINRTRHV